MVGSIHLEATFTQTGAVIADWNFRVITLNRHLMMFSAETMAMFPPKATDYGQITIEMLFYLCVALMFLKEMVNVFKLGFHKYRSQFWNLIDLTNSLIFILMIGFRITTITMLGSINWKPKASEYVDFRSVAWIIYQMTNWTAANILLAYIKIFKYVRLSPRLAILLESLARSYEDLKSFSVLFAMVFMAYAISCWVAFGRDLESFKDLTSSVYFLISVILGEVSFNQLRESNQYLGPFLFISYVLVVLFTLVNIFICIVCNAHAAVREEGEQEDDEFVEALKNGLGRIGDRVGRLFGREAKTDEEDIAAAELAQDVADDEIIKEFEEAEEELRLEMGHESLSGVTMPLGESQRYQLALINRIGDFERELEESDSGNSRLRGSSLQQIIVDQSVEVTRELVRSMKGRLKRQQDQVLLGSAVGRGPLATNITAVKGVLTELDKKQGEIEAMAYVILPELREKVAQVEAALETLTLKAIAKNGYVINLKDVPAEI